MKRLVLLAIPLALLIGLVITLVVLDVQRKPDWRKELDGYIRQALPSERIIVRSVGEAGQPRNFKETMGEAVRGEGWTWSIDELPFPPQAVKCVLLERRKAIAGGGEESKLQVVFVGYHTDDLWRVGWLVHEGPVEPFPPTLTDHLAAIGCNLNLEGALFQDTTSSGR